LLDSCGHHQLPLYGTEQLGHSIIHKPIYRPTEESFEKHEGGKMIDFFE